jgi:hypothetical protein
MTHELQFERVIDAEPEVVFDAFAEPGGQVAFYGQDEPGWIVRSECDLRIGVLRTVDVFAKSLERADWPESRIARGDLAEEVAKLTRDSDKDLIAWGGALFAQSLARQRLIDGA